MRKEILCLFCACFFLIAFFNSCSKPKKGCTDSAALNFDANAKDDDGSCQYPPQTPDTISPRLIGIWDLNTYLSNGTDQTQSFDSAYRNYTLKIDSYNLYSFLWSKETVTHDSLIVSDTVGFDTVNLNYIIINDTFHFMDTVITPQQKAGSWIIQNDGQDLKLTDAGSQQADIFRITQLDSANLRLRKGGEEYYYRK